MKALLNNFMFSMCLEMNITTDLLFVNFDKQDEIKARSFVFLSTKIVSWICLEVMQELRKLNVQPKKMNSQQSM